MKQIFVALCLLGHASVAIAQDTPVVRVDVTPKEISVGEPIRLRVTVLGPTWFPKPPVFPSFEITNAIVRLPPNSSRATSERVGQDTWSGVVRNYQVFPLIGASYRLDELTMRVTYANPGKSNITVDLDVPLIEFRAVVPEGAEGLDPYLAGRELTLGREIEGEYSTLEVGDALVVNYTAELDGLPAIFLPTLIEESETPGVSVYVDAPIVQDGAPARRSEKATYIFEAGGDFVLPAVQLRWWNIESSTIETASVAALTVSVVGPPVVTEPIAQRATERNWWPMIGGTFALLVTVILLVRRTTYIRDRWRAHRKQRRESEVCAFHLLRKALQSGSPHASYDALATWLKRVNFDSGARQFALAYGSTELLQHIDKLSQSLYSDTTETVDLRRLEHQIAAARRRLQRESKGYGQATLPPLNP